MTMVLLLLGALCAHAASRSLHLQLPRVHSSSVLPEQGASSSSTCGPQLSIETPACSVVAQADGYELRNYPDGQVRLAAPHPLPG